jgi:DNA-binding NarL/FixJ family response regulator
LTAGPTGDQYRSILEPPDGSVDAALRVLIVDDHTLLRQVLGAALADHPRMQVVGEGATGAEALGEARRLRPDIVILDLGLPDIDGVEVIQQLRAELPTTEVVILTSSERDDHLLAALQAGARGYVLKTSDYRDLVASLDQIAMGLASLPPEIVSRLLMHLPSRRPPPVQPMNQVSREQFGPPDELSVREIDVLRLIVAGARNRDIAVRLGLSENTVRSYVTHIMQKLRVDNRVQIAAEAVRRGIVSLDQ